jgi:hypothetical protein
VKECGLHNSSLTPLDSHSRKHVVRHNSQIRDLSVSGLIYQRGIPSVMGSASDSFQGFLPHLGKPLPKVSHDRIFIG